MERLPSYTGSHQGQDELLARSLSRKRGDNMVVVAILVILIIVIPLLALCASAFGLAGA